MFTSIFKPNSGRRFHMRKLIAALALTTLMASSAALRLTTSTVHADDNPPIIFNDQMPAVDVVITPDNGAPGVVYVDLQDVSLRLLDSQNASVLSVIDKRISLVA